MARKIAILLLLALGFNALALTVVWIHYNMVTASNPYLAPVFALLQLLLLIACVWVAGRYLVLQLRKFIVFSPGMLFLLGAATMTTTYILDEFFFSRSLLDPARTSSLLSDARLYAQLLFVLLFLVLAGAYHFFPVIAHRPLKPNLGYLHFWITFACAYLLAYPKNLEGLSGMPRRYMDWSRPASHNTEFILLAAQGLFLVNLFNSTAKQ